MKPLNKEILEDSAFAFVVGIVFYPVIPLVGLLIMLASGSFIGIILFDSIPCIGGK